VGDKNESDSQFSPLPCCPLLSTPCLLRRIFLSTGNLPLERACPKCWSIPAKDGRCKSGSSPPSADSGTELVATESSRGFFQIGYRSKQILFSFYNGELYKISVIYDQNLHGRTHRRRHGEVHFGQIRPRDKCLCWNSIPQRSTGMT